MINSRSGFTIVELLIVIVVIGILASITVVAYGGIQQKAFIATLKSDLANASKKMELAAADTGSYPTSFPSGTKASPNIALSLSQASPGYCVNGQLVNDSTIQWQYSTTNGGLQSGLCSGAVIPGSELGINPNLVTNTDFSNGWGLNMQDPTGRSLSIRPGVAGDPFSTRPVLVLNNTSTNPTSWAILQATELNRPAIVTGSTYVKTFYVRKTGTTFSRNVDVFGLMDGNATSVSLNVGSPINISTNWQKVTETSVALQSPPNSNVLYLPVAYEEFVKTGWTLEFQGFEIRQK